MKETTNREKSAKKQLEKERRNQEKQDLQNVQKDRETQSEITNTRTEYIHAKMREHRKTNRRMVHTENNFNKGNEEVKK